MGVSLRPGLVSTSLNLISAFKSAHETAVNYVVKLTNSTGLYFLSAFTVSVLFATLTFSRVTRPAVFNIYVVFIGLILVCDIAFFVTRPKGVLQCISETIFSKVLPLVCSIATIAWIFQHTTFGAFADYATKHVDEYEYVNMMLNGILASNSIPHRFRWLTPFLTGTFNILPVEGLPTFTVFNFACLITTAVVLIKILQELEVNQFLSLLVPVFLFNAFLGRYAAKNHYLTDPASYMFFSIFLWCLLDPKRYAYLGWLLPLGVLNSEKCVYWLPIIAFFVIKEYGLKKGTAKALLLLGPAVLVFFIPRLLLGQGLVANLTPPEHSPSNLSLLLSLPFTYVYFPFGFLTIFFVMGFNRLPFVLKISSFILIPVYAQLAIAGFAGDDNRMLAYTFIIYIPAALFYVQKLFERVPYELGVLMTIPLLLLAYFDYRFTLPICFLILLTGTEIIPGLKQHAGLLPFRTRRLQPKSWRIACPELKTDK